jgi:hypothetical protein
MLTVCIREGVQACIATDLFIKTCEVKLVLDVVLINLTKELVASEAAEPRDPTDLFRTTHFGLKKKDKTLL